MSITLLKPRKFNMDQDYNSVAAWWEARGWPAIPKDMLSENGLIIDDYCAGWVYSLTNSLYLVECVVSNPGSNKIIRNSAMNTLVDSLCETAKQKGARAAMSFVSQTNTPQLLKRYEDRGFKQTDRNMVSIWRDL
jgi:hypothetical protein